jgi:hypothetical protein
MKEKQVPTNARERNKFRLALRSKTDPPAIGSNWLHSTRVNRDDTQTWGGAEALGV